jgi:hypothetical protein
MKDKQPAEKNPLIEATEQTWERFKQNFLPNAPDAVVEHTHAAYMSGVITATGSMIEQAAAKDITAERRQQIFDEYTAWQVTFIQRQITNSIVACILGVLQQHAEEEAEGTLEEEPCPTKIM